MKTLGLLLAALLAAGCTKVDTFNCLESSECLLAGVPGVCEPGNLCSFPDASCPSGKAYGEYAGDQASQCVGGGPGTTTTPTSLSDTGTGTITGSATGSDTSVDPSIGTTTAVDPTTTTTTTTTTTDPVTSDPVTSDPVTSDPSTTGPACAAFGGACGGGTPCCGGACTTCGKEGTCQAQPADMGPAVCGSACTVCGANGECAVAPPGQTCALDCSDIVLDAQVVEGKTLCHGYAAKPLMSTCEGAKCSVPDPVAAGCVSDAPTVMAQCDTVCVQDASLCVPLAVGVSNTDFCFLNAPAPNCKTACSADLTASLMAGCDAQGTCQSVPKPCGAYTCNAGTGQCRTKCMVASDCVSGKCQGTKCQ